MPEASVTDRLAAHLRSGTRLDLLPDVVEDEHGLIDEQVMTAWGIEHEIDAERIRDLLLGRIVQDPDPRGLRLRGARIRGVLDLEQVTTAITLELADCLLEGGVRAHGAHLPGLWMHRCRLNSVSGPAFGGDRLQVDTLVSFAYSVVTTEHSRYSAAKLMGARIDGALSFSNAQLRGGSGGVALIADGLRTSGDLYLDDGFTAHGGVSLIDAEIGGALDCRGARLHAVNGAALDADRITTTGAVRLDEVNSHGGVRITDARIGGHLDAAKAVLSSTDGTALALDRTAVVGNVYLNRGFVADGDGHGGAVRMVSTRIGGQLNCRTATFRNSSGPALSADRLHVGGNGLLDRDVLVSGSGPWCTLRLAGAQIEGTLRCVGNSVTSATDTTHRWDVDGLTYQGVPEVDPAGNHRAAWLSLLRTGTPAYTAQPYQQLAAVFRADGHDGEVRAILMEQRRAQLDRGALTQPADRAWARITGLLLGFGYQPWRALIYLLGVLAVSVALAVLLGGCGGLDRTNDQAAPSAPAAGTPTAAAAGSATARMSCALSQQIGVGLDLGTPFLPAERSCSPTTTSAGQALTISRWVLQLAAWALAALFVTGFTGIIRKT